MSVKGRLKALSRKRLVIYLGVSALLVIIIYSIPTHFFLPPTVPDFELQVTDWDYNPSIGTFRVSGTTGIQVPPSYRYRLNFVSITDGNKTIILNYEKHGGIISIELKTSLRNTRARGPDWAFLLTQGIILESKNIQLTFEYEIRHEHYGVLETGTEVFSVNVE
jgi:hypothetical protein